MKIVRIPEPAMEAARKVMRKMRSNEKPWWFKNVIRTQGIEARSLSTGKLKPGLTVYLIAGHNRDVYPDDAHKYSLQEYVGIVADSGSQVLVQLGRDVEMVEDKEESPYSTCNGD